uniref:endo-polygalacturonase n=1 Tax=Diabrotica virgifera virgifera TaxID=50390 RepID=A0A6P7FT70_DIAVI
MYYTIMCYLFLFLLFNAALVICKCSPTNCEITNFDQVSDTVHRCSDIIIRNLDVPAGQTLELDLKQGASLSFEGITTFDYTNWSGPLIRINGSGFTIKGAPGSLLNGQGDLYWDHLGDKGPKKPQFIKIEAFDGSIIENINLLNCPHHCVYVGKSDGLTIRGWVIDNSYGDQNNFTGHNTDGFDVSAASNLIIEDSTVINQDDCIAIRHGYNILVRNMYCAGGHGLSLSAGFSYTTFQENTITNVVIKDSVIARSANGIHVKTHADAYNGRIQNVTYENIFMSGLINYGINVQQDYVNGSATGVANNNIPIYNLNLINIRGTVRDSDSEKSMPVYINCGKSACHEWSWSNINIAGGSNSSICNYTPDGYQC